MGKGHKAPKAPGGHKAPHAPGGHKVTGGGKVSGYKAPKKPRFR